MLNLYVTSAKQGDGKTFISAGIAATMQSLGYSTSVYKPIQTGCIELNGFMQSPDIAFVKEVDPYINTSYSYLFKTKEEPLIAAEQENEFIDIDLINSEYSKLIYNFDCTIVDGNNGLLSPLETSVQNIDLIKRMQSPCLYVVTPDENAINDTLQSIYIAQEKGIEIRGVIINNIKNDCPKKHLTSITRIIEEYSNVNILGLIPHLGEKIIPEELITGILNGIDIESVFKVKIEKLEFSQW